MRLEGKSAIVTGAGSGMGEAIAVLFAKEGAKVVVSDINGEAVNRVVEQIKANGGDAIGIVTNVALQADVDHVVEQTVQTYGKLDILVNNAGVMDNFVPAGDVTDESWDRVIAINLSGPFKTARAAIKVMEQQDRGGVIINNASVGGLFGCRGGAAYVSSKHGLIGLTKNLAGTYGVYGKIRANAIAPGGVNTNINSTITAPHPLGLQAIGGLGRAPMGEATQIAQVALFLASDESNFVNGEVITADGGWTAG